MTEQEKQKLYEEIFNQINTIYEVKYVLKQLEQLIQSLFEKSSVFEVKVNQYLENNLRDKILFLCEKSNIDLKDPSAVQKIILDLREKIHDLPVVELKIAFDPTAESVNHISDWFYYNLKKKVILDFEVDNKLIGGAVIGYEGKIGNHTIKKKMEERYKPEQLITS